MSLKIFHKYIEYKSNSENVFQKILNKNKIKIIDDYFPNEDLAKFMFNNYSKEDLLDYAHIFHVMFLYKPVVSSWVIGSVIDALKIHDVSLPDYIDSGIFFPERRFKQDFSFNEHREIFRQHVEEHYEIKEAWLRIVEKHEPALLVKMIEEKELVDILIILQNNRLTQDDIKALAELNIEYKKSWVNSFLSQKEKTNISQKKYFHQEYKSYEDYLHQEYSLSSLSQMFMRIIECNDLKYVSSLGFNIESMLRNYELYNLTKNGFVIYQNIEGKYDKKFQAFNVFSSKKWDTLKLMLLLDNEIPKATNIQNKLIKF